MDCETTIEALRTFFASREHVLAAYLYGSVARDEAGPESDVDVGILLPPGGATTLHALAEEIEDALVCRLGHEVEIVALNHAPVDLVHRVLRDSVLVAEHDRSARIAFEVRARNEYWDLLPILRRYRRLDGEVA